MNQTHRILHIFTQLMENQEICTKKVAQKFNMDIRTIQRDIKILKDFLKDSMSATKQGCYMLIDETPLIKPFSNIKDIAKIKDFLEFLILFDNNFSQILNNKSFSFIKKIQKNSEQIFHIHEHPIEKISNIDIFDDLKKAISYKRYLDIVYFEKKHSDLKRIKPLKIVFAKGNWYLASMTKNYKTNGGFKFFRINFIKEVKILPETFKTDQRAIDFIQNFQSLFQNYKDSAYEVKLWVDKEIQRHFRVKKYLKSQKNYPQKDGNLIVTYQINCDMEIIPLIKRWMPYVKIIYPNSLKEKIKEDILKYLD